MLPRLFLNELICIIGIYEIYLLVYDTKKLQGMAALGHFFLLLIISILTFSLSSFGFIIGWNAEPREILIPTIGLFLSAIPASVMAFSFSNYDPMIGGLLGFLSLIGLVMLGISTIGITQTFISMTIFGLTVLLWLLFRIFIMPNL